MNLEFMKGTVKNRRTTLPVLIRTEDRGHVKTGDETVCSKSCYTEMENSMYLVLWEFRLSETVMLNTTPEGTPELTSDLHPFLERNNLKTTVTHICFRVNYLQVGYLLTLNITEQ